MKLLKSLLSAAAVACLVAAPLSAQAGLTMTLSDGINPTVTIVDGGLGDLNGSANAITFSGIIGAWTLNVTTGVGVGFTPGINGLDLNSVNATSAAGGTLNIQLSQDGLTFGSGGSAAVNGLMHGNHSGGAYNITYGLYTSNSNALFATTDPAFVGSGSGSGLSGFVGAGGTSIALTNPYSMTMVTRLTHVGAGQTSYDFASDVPEPASIALVGLALVGLGAASRRKA